MVGDRPRQLPRIPLPDLVRALTFVRGNKLGWLARTLPIVGNVDVSSEYGRKAIDEVFTVVPLCGDSRQLTCFVNAPSGLVHAVVIT